MEDPTMNARVTETRQDPRSESRDDTPSLTPRVDVLEDAAGITLLADLPGVSKESLDIKVDSDSLVIEGAVSVPAPQDMEATYAEVRVPRFRRSFALSRELDTGRIEAGLKDGVLSLRIPKHAEAQPRRIAVKVV
jgi:HSP20 family molecular chaperone IbpA